MTGLIAISIGLYIGFSPIGRIPAIRFFVKLVTGG